MNSGDTDAPALKLVRSERPLVIGHRGGCGSAPENTLPSFTRALEEGADLVELDYHTAKDGVPIVFHDETLDRTTDARGVWRKSRIRIADRTAAEIQSLDAGAWFNSKFAGARVPLLTEALDFIRAAGGIPLIEHKSGAAAACVKLLRERELINKVVVVSFDWAYLRAFHELEPAQILGALGPPTLLASGRKTRVVRKALSKRWLDLLTGTGARLVVWNRNASPQALSLARARGLPVWIYTINEPVAARRFMAAGVKGIITNNPALIRRAIKSI